MGLLDELRKKEGVLKTAGFKIKAEAGERGTSFSYVDAAEPDVIIVETKGETTRSRPSSAMRQARR